MGHLHGATWGHRKVHKRVRWKDSGYAQKTGLNSPWDPKAAAGWEHGAAPLVSHLSRSLWRPWMHDWSRVLEGWEAKRDPAAQRLSELGCCWSRMSLSDKSRRWRLWVRTSEMEQSGRSYGMSRAPAKGPGLQWAWDTWWVAMGQFEPDGHRLSEGRARAFGGRIGESSCLRSTGLRGWACTLEVGFGEEADSGGKKDMLRDKNRKNILLKN